MNTYRIHIIRAAERDLLKASDHIEFVLKNPQVADELLDEAESKTNVLSVFPEKFALAEDTLLSSWGIRFTMVKNYPVFYLIDQQKVNSMSNQHKGEYYSSWMDENDQLTSPLFSLRISI